MKSQTVADARITRWWWIRHAPVVGDGGRIYGQADLDCDCSDIPVFAALERMLPREPLWLTSNLARTHQTAQAIMTQRGDEERACTPIKDFAEQFLGDWQGLAREAFFAGRRPQAGSYWFGPADERAPGGESFTDLCGRVEPAIARLNQENAGRDIVAVAHGGTIRAALRLALGIDAQTALAFAIRNCALTRIDHVALADEAGWRVAFVNFYPLG
ncbi:histidine phosphatase family protein [Saliniramus sp.]|uniref:histidine phosphatase family protein n=1 Tax=Saliniramus sp. TaxID=2986772 RepID=UPI002C5F4787|nr:histidine phosphatase family protein [Saliniramus sp.]HMB09883.1 histidine phosphatase family protein [Saliniramus sp.]